MSGFSAEEILKEQFDRRLNDEERQLLAAAEEQMKYSYAPYSQFTVGAALRGADGKIYPGCNVENSSYGAGCCAERTAVFRAVSDGERDFAMLAIAGGAKGQVTEPAFPCGICRQVLSEFVGPSFPILLLTGKGALRTTLGDLFPGAFTLSDYFVEK